MVTFGSYNSTGMDIAKIKWIKDIIIEHEIYFFAIQEHFKNTKTTQKYFSDHFSYKRCFKLLDKQLAAVLGDCCN